MSEITEFAPNLQGNICKLSPVVVYKKVRTGLLSYYPHRFGSCHAEGDPGLQLCSVGRYEFHPWRNPLSLV